MIMHFYMLQCFKKNKHLIFLQQALEEIKQNYLINIMIIHYYHRLKECRDHLLELIWQIQEMILLQQVEMGLLDYIELSAIIN